MTISLGNASAATFYTGGNALDERDEEDRSSGVQVGRGNKRVFSFFFFFSSKINAFFRVK